MSEQQLARALETNSFQSTATAAGLINPTLWVSMIEDFAKAKTVMRALGKERMEILGQAGKAFNVQFNAEISAAALTESTAITPSAISYTQVTYTPSEYGIAVALTRKQDIRSINDIMAEKAKDMGYALAKLLDQNIFSALQATDTRASTIAEVTANGVAVSAIASSDTVDTDDIANALFELENADEEGKYLVIHPGHVKALRKLSDFIDASVYGGREVVLNGEIGKYLGLRVLVTTLVPRNATTSTARNAYVLGEDAFGIGWKMATMFNSDYKVLEREYILAAVHEYDAQVERPARACRLVAYVG